jgi:hypothetical protein
VNPSRKLEKSLNKQRNIISYELPCMKGPLPNSGGNGMNINLIDWPRKERRKSNRGVE